MTTTEAFKFGFLMRCAEEGLSPVQTRERMAKFAAMQKQAFPGEQMLGNVAGAAGKGLGWLAGAAVKAPIIASGASALAGVGGGYALSKAMDDAVDPNEARDEEVIAEYRRAIQQLTRRHQMAAVA